MIFELFLAVFSLLAKNESMCCQDFLLRPLGVFDRGLDAREVLQLLPTPGHYLYALNFVHGEILWLVRVFSDSLGTAFRRLPFLGFRFDSFGD